MTLPLGFSLTADFFGRAWLFLVILLAAALLLYLTNHRRAGIEGVSRSGLRLILLLRFLAVLLLLLLIFDPQLSLVRTQSHPKRVAVLLDRSASMLNAWEGEVQDLQAGTQSIFDQLELKNEVDLWSLDGTVLARVDGEYADRQTFFNWSPALGRDPADQDDVYASVFLVTDGHLNGGRSPMDQAWSTSLPIYPLLPLTPGSDQSLKLLESTSIPDPDHEGQFLILLKLQQAGLEGRQLSGSLRGDLTGGQSSVHQTIRSTFIELVLPVTHRADHDQKLTAQLRVDDTEIALTAEILIKALAPRKQVLLLSERVNALHKFLRMSYPDSLFELTSRIGTLEKGQDSDLGIKARELDLIILNQITESYSNPVLLKTVADAVKQNCPLIIFLDTETPMSRDWSELFGLRYTDLHALRGDFSLEWNRQAHEHPFYIGLLGKAVKQSDLLKAAPLTRAEYGIEAPGTVLWNLGIGANSTPAMVLSDRPPQLVLSGGDFWKLFFHPESGSFMANLWAYLNTYLLDIADFKPVKIQSYMTKASTGAMVPLEVQVRDIDGSPIRNAEIRVWQEDPAGRTTSLELMDKLPGRYSVQIQTQLPGSQTIVAEAYRFGELWGRDTSRIELLAFSGEDQSRGVDATFLNRLAQRSGARVLKLGEDAIPEIPREMYVSILSYHWNGLRSPLWFILLVLVLTGEWIIRRRQGLL